MEHKLIRGGEQWLPFARSRVKALQATGMAYAHQQFVMPDGTDVSVRIQPGHEYIDLSGGCRPRPGYLLTRSAESASPVEGFRDVYSATFPSSYDHGPDVDAGGTHRITPRFDSDGVQQEFTDIDPGRKLKVPSNASNTDVRNQRWPSLFTGYMRLVTQYAQLDETGNLFNYVYGHTHGAWVHRNEKNKVDGLWIIEISDAIYAAKVDVTACECSGVAAFLKKYKPKPEEIGYILASDGMISLKWVYANRENNGFVRLLDLGQVPEGVGTPICNYRSWAFSYSGAEAQAVLFKTADNANAYIVDRVKMTILSNESESGRIEPVGVTFSVVDHIDAYVNNIGMLVWFPAADRPLNYEQLDVAASKARHPPLTCSSVPLDVYYVGETAQVSFVSQGDGIGTTEVDETASEADCVTDWQRGGFPVDPEQFSGSYERRISGTGQPDEFNTPAGVFRRRAGDEQIVSKRARIQPIDSWLVRVNFEIYVGHFSIYEQYGWRIIESSTTEIDYSSKAALILNYFDRESVVLVTLEVNSRAEVASKQFIWAFLNNSVDRATEGELLLTTPVIRQPPNGWTVHPGCTQHGSGRLGALGGYGDGEDPPVQITSTVSSTDKMAVTIHLGGQLFGGSIPSGGNRAAPNDYLEFRNKKFGMSEFEPVTLYGMASAGMTVNIDPKATKKVVNGSVITNVAGNNTETYAGDVPQPDPQGSYRGYVGPI